jgi:hypothetical protein
MDRKKRIHDLLSKMADDLLGYIKEQELFYQDRWVPSVYIKKELNLNLVCVPKNNKQYGEKGWLLAILARMLEDQGRIEHHKVGNRAFFRSLKS